MFTWIFGENPFVKVLDFMTDHLDYDYSVSDIAEYSEVSRPSVYRVLPALLEKGIIAKTREVGNSTMYKLDTGNSVVRQMLKFDFELSRLIAESEKVPQATVQKTSAKKNARPQTRHSGVATFS
ncbi:MAG: hypothetical protein CVT48_06290 [Thermoplasmata archaeon HGW-Thermoplasmata-1]|nr:MAG: hypothetical protein CVT48_06290 [Thermoplasmata archaeon HGW-Thermoplasmata-1]